MNGATPSGSYATSVLLLYTFQPDGLGGRINLKIDVNLTQSIQIDILLCALSETSSEMSCIPL